MRFRDMLDAGIYRSIDESSPGGGPSDPPDGGAPPEGEPAAQTPAPRYMTVEEHEAALQDFGGQLIGAMRQLVAAPAASGAGDEDDDVPDPQLDPAGFARHLREMNRRDRQELLQEFEARQVATQNAQSREQTNRELIINRAGLDPALCEGYSAEDLKYIAGDTRRAKAFKPANGKPAPGIRTDRTIDPEMPESLDDEMARALGSAFGTNAVSAYRKDRKGR